MYGRPLEVSKIQNQSSKIFPYFGLFLFWKSKSAPRAKSRNSISKKFMFFDQNPVSNAESVITFHALEL